MVFKQLLCIFMLLAISTAQKTYSIVDFGAIPFDETTSAAFKNADAIMTAFARAEMEVLNDQQLINSEDIQRIIIWVPHGLNFTVMPVNVVPQKRSVPITLQIDGTILLSKDAFSYEKIEGEDPDVLVFRNWVDFKIEGEGMIDGQGFMWWVREYLQTNPPHQKRPRMFNGYNLTNFEMSGIYATNSPRFFFRFNDCDGIHIHDMEIFTDTYGQLQLDQLFMPESWQNQLLNVVTSERMHFFVPTFPLNTDGIDIYGRNALIERVKITTFDDAVVLKPSHRNRLIKCTENVVVRNSTFVYGVGASIGSIGASDNYNCIRNATFENITFESPFKAIYVKSNPGEIQSTNEAGAGGIVENLVYQNLVINNAIWWGIYIGPQQQKQPDGKGPGCMLYPFTDCDTNRMVQFRNITVRNTTINGSILPPGIIRCPPEAPCFDINFENVQYYGLWRFIGPGYLTINAYGSVQNSHPHPHIVDQETNEESPFDVYDFMNETWLFACYIVESIEKFNAILIL